MIDDVIVVGVMSDDDNTYVEFNSRIHFIG